jgi:branched-chain amino acid transport system ATP-binding protein
MSRESAAPVLEVDGLRRAFGGLVAVNDLGFASVTARMSVDSMAGAEDGGKGGGSRR